MLMWHLIQCPYCSDPIHTNVTCMPAQLPGTVDPCCGTCLNDVCDKCHLPKMEEYSQHCNCPEHPRHLHHDIIKNSLECLLTTDNLNHIMHKCATFQHPRTNRSLSRAQLVLPEYSDATESAVWEGITAECMALYEKNIMRSNVLVYSKNVPISANDCRLNETDIMVNNLNHFSFFVYQARNIIFHIYLWIYYVCFSISNQALNRATVEIYKIHTSFASKGYYGPFMVKHQSKNAVCGRYKYVEHVLWTYVHV